MLDPFLIFDALGRDAVDDFEDAVALLGLDDDDMQLSGSDLHS